MYDSHLRSWEKYCLKMSVDYSHQGCLLVHLNKKLKVNIKYQSPERLWQWQFSLRMSDRGKGHKRCKDDGALTIWVSIAENNGLFYILREFCRLSFK